MRDLAPTMSDYLATRASFRLEVPEVYNYARDVVDTRATEPGKLALLAVGPDGGDARRFSFADLAASSDRAARFLAGQGVGKGDRVLVMLPRVPDWYDVVLGWSSLRHCVSAGEPLNPEAIKVWHEATGLTVYDGYGQTETVNLVANFRCLEVRPGSMGKPTPGFDVVVIDDEDRVLGPGQEGHVAVRVRPERPAGLFTGYWRDPEATAAAFHGDFYDTGDRAYVDEDGYFWFVGRADDVITSAAYRIVPFEVESALVEHPAVAEAAVVGKPDPQRGQVVKAFVVPAPGHEGTDALVAQLQEHCRTITAPTSTRARSSSPPSSPRPSPARSAASNSGNAS